jgi:glycosyltransferase involved in cell wall biosynthesis
MANGSRPGPRVLYIVYWGAAEPLGQSLVLPAVRELAAIVGSLTLVTFEKPADLSRIGEIAYIKASLEEHGVAWLPLRYHKKPKAPATAYDVLQGVAHSLALALKSRPDIIHARTFVGGLVGSLAAPLLGAKLIYHNEGFYPDEQVDAGVWKAGSTPHRLARSLEDGMYARADGIIALSNRARTTIEAMPAVKRKGTPLITVPSCVDLDHFRPDCPKAPWMGKPLRLIYIGSVGGRYLLDKIGRFAAVASQMADGVSLRILTKAEPGLVASMLGSGGLSRGSWSLDSVSRREMPGELACHDAGLFFLASGISEHGCSPTKIGEYWAMGLPVITSPGVSDTDEIIRNERVGVIVSNHSDESYRRAVFELTSLLRDPETPERCRRAAEKYYSLEKAWHRQALLYDRIYLSSPTVDTYACGAGQGNPIVPRDAEGE